MKLSIEEDVPSHVQVKVEGNVTQRDLEKLADPLSDLLGPGVYDRLVLINLGDSKYIDSSGVGWLLACHKRFRTHGGKLVLHSLQPLVANVLHILRLDSLFHIAANRQAALELTREAQV